MFCFPSLTKLIDQKTNVVLHKMLKAKFLYTQQKIVEINKEKNKDAC